MMPTVVRFEEEVTESLAISPITACPITQAQATIPGRRLEMITPRCAELALTANELHLPYLTE